MGMNDEGGDGMRLENLLDGLAFRENQADQDVEISGICYDTREIKPGDLFVALPGYKTDGHKYIEKAMVMGAAAVVCQTLPPTPGPWITVDTPRAALAILSANWFGHPAKELAVIGVTGTNGKTTTTYLMKAVLEDTLGAKVGLIGTNQNMIGERIIPTHRTTPESYEVQKLLRDMVDSGCTHAVMEVSSHALVLHRVDGILFRAGIFTNLTRDHLDFHGSMEEYRAAKALLFDRCERAILNLDDETGDFYAKTVPCATFTYSERKDEADLTAKNLRLFPDRVEFEAVALGAISRIKLPIPGGFTVYNALGVIACGLCLGIELRTISVALGKAAGVKGRIEVVPTPTDYTVIIDYAHTPDALENILTTVRDFTKGRLICLFGCGGDRDRTKRPMMGAAASQLADFVVVTSDNPRTEDPHAIIADIRAGMVAGGANYVVIPDRRAAIRYALDGAKSGDVLVLAGKGHETYQEIDGVYHHLDEREEVVAYFEHLASP